MFTGTFRLRSEHAPPDLFLLNFQSDQDPASLVHRHTDQYYSIDSYTSPAGAVRFFAHREVSRFSTGK